MELDREYTSIAIGLSAALIVYYVSDVINEARDLDRIAKANGRSEGVPMYCAKIVSGEAREVVRGFYNVIP